MTTWCPRCDDQGAIVKARIIATGEIVRICGECDALWPDGAELRIDNFVDFSTFVKPKGLQGLWSELEIIKED